MKIQENTANTSSISVGRPQSIEIDATKSIREVSKQVERVLDLVLEGYNDSKKQLVPT